MIQGKVYEPVNRIRIITATSLFDGHDVSINIMRRILQNCGVEVIHLGHSRGASEIVNCAIQEDVQAIAITSYQGGHLEYFKYIYDLLKERKASHIKIFGGGGGTILPSEIEQLHSYGIARLYSSDDGRRLGLQGMINDLMEQSDFPTTSAHLSVNFDKLADKDFKAIGNLISIAENEPEQFSRLYEPHLKKSNNSSIPVIGITGTGGSGKSTLVDELVRRYLMDFSDKTIAVISVDPTKRKTGGALLGDRIRMNSINNQRVFMRSMATRQINSSLSKSIYDAVRICKASAFDCIILETSGIGQSGSEIVDCCDVSLYVMTSEYGSASQLEKIDMLDYADLIAVNKFDKSGSPDALRDVKKQFRRNKDLWEVKEEMLPVYGTIASQYNDYATDLLYAALLKEIEKRKGLKLRSNFKPFYSTKQAGFIIPAGRNRYLEEIVETNQAYDRYVDEQATIARRLYQLHETLGMLKGVNGNVLETSNTNETTVEKNRIEHSKISERKGIFSKADMPLLDLEENNHTSDLEMLYQQLADRLDNSCKMIIEGWTDFKESYQAPALKYKVRDNVFEHDLYTTSLSNLKIPKISIPNYENWDDIIKWVLKENVPGKFPYTAGVFPLKRSEESSTRMTAGEGGPERSNKRFHYLCQGQRGKRISTAHDSVTLYGEDPDFRPDIYGKIGSTGVSVCNLDDAKKLYSGFNLADPSTSVNLTINGPAPMILGFFLNVAIDQQCELYIREQGMAEEVKEKIASHFASKDISLPYYNGTLPNENNGLGLLLLGTTGDQMLERSVYEKIKAKTLASVRGTVQSDILKEDQAQNTCIFSIDFALKMMGDVQEYFINKQIKNFYSISVSGYHIAEAGANPLTQLAFTLANAFTFVEYFLSRGMHIDDFAPNMSFFFSNGMDPEYAVLGRVARRIWAKTIKLKYGGNDRSQKLKYHIQTSGRSLQAHEMGYNDVRTTLQALYALSDNCNSLHTNASDEAISLPTEESVRTALAIQLIINKELGLARNENPLQGSFIIDELTQKVEAAVLNEFKNISDRGGVLGAMERMYQRSKIQEESLYYETLKHSGALPVVGVNTFLNDQLLSNVAPPNVIRSTIEERDFAIHSKMLFQKINKVEADKMLAALKKTALCSENIFNQMMEACKVCTLGQISQTLYEIGGQYRRNA